MRRNIVNTYDSLFPLFGDPTYSGEFYDLASSKTFQNIPMMNAYQGEIYSELYTIDKIQNIHSRYVYSFLDFISDIAGVFDLLIVVLGVLFLRVSNFSFKLDVIGKLYRVRT